MNRKNNNTYENKNKSASFQLKNINNMNLT